MNYLGIDFGGKRVGLAVGNDTDNIAFPREVVLNNKSLLEKIGEYIEKEQIGSIVLGESKNLDGTPNPIMKNIEEFSVQLRSEYSIPVLFEPETYTSQEAQLLQGKNEMIDASAASLILNSFFQRQKHQKGESGTHADIYDSIDNI